MTTQLRRKVRADLLEWKRHNRGTSVAFVDGARRVGKSTIYRHFAQRGYRSYLLVDFGHLPSGVQEIFEHNSNNLEVFFLKLATVYHTTLYRRESMIIFDEVQLYPPARQLIEYLMADGRCDYIGTGFLTVLKKHAGDGEILIPSEEEHLQMFPFDLEEYLWAKGNENTIPILHELFERRVPLGQASYRRVMNDFRAYVLMGGMPQAVCEFMENAGLEQVGRIKRRIINLYREDVSEFAKGHEARVYAVFNQIPSRLSKQEKKFRLADLEKSAHFRTYEEAFAWLDEAMVVNTCFDATSPIRVLAMGADHSTLKCYLGNTSLSTALTLWDQSYRGNDLYQAILLDKTNVNEGMLVENVIVQMLRAAGHRLFSYSRTDPQNHANTMEIDFLVSHGRQICPIEVKSGRYQYHASLDKFRTKFSTNLGQGYILYGKDLPEKDGILHLPLYMTVFL